MPNFDFLQPGHPSARANVEVRPPRYLTWGWSIEVTTWLNQVAQRYGGAEKKREYSLAVLTDDALYVRTGYQEMRERLAAIAELNAFEPPEVLKKNYVRYPLGAIFQLRYCEPLGLLEIVHFDGRGAPIVDEKSKQTGLIFEALRNRLVPQASIETEDMQGWKNLKGSLAGFGATLLLMIPTIYLALTYAPNRARIREKNPAAAIVDFFSAEFGTMPILALAGVAIFAAFAFLAYRHLHPLQAKTVTIKQ